MQIWKGLAAVALTCVLITSKTLYSVPQENQEEMMEEVMTDSKVHSSSQTTEEHQQSTEAEDLFSGLRVEYAEGFYFEPISIALQQRITGISYPQNCPVALSDLKHVRVQYYNFQNEVQSGELIVNGKIAMKILEIFKELFDAKYPIEKIQLIDVYGGNDEASMSDNNTSAFNYRCIDGTNQLSDHSLGLAVDINPRYNPYVRTGFGARDVLPQNGIDYADRTREFPHKIQKDDLCYRAFVSRGFLWGGEWDEPVDYQHFYFPG